MNTSRAQLLAFTDNALPRYFLRVTTPGGVEYSTNYSARNDEHAQVIANNAMREFRSNQLAFTLCVFETIPNGTRKRRWIA